MSFVCKEFHQRRSLPLSSARVRGAVGDPKVGVQKDENPSIVVHRREPFRACGVKVPIIGLICPTPECESGTVSEPCPVGLQEHPDDEGLLGTSVSKKRHFVWGTELRHNKFRGRLFSLCWHSRDNHYGHFRDNVPSF